MLLLTAVVLLYWILLFVQELFNLASLPKLDSAAEPFARPLVSIIVPARNEAVTIEPAVRSLLAQDYGSFEVIAVDDRSTDATGPILDEIAVTDSRLVVIRGEEPPEGWLGKPWALHQGTRCAGGELLLFVDADVCYRPEALRAAVAFFLGRDLGVLSLFPRFKMRGFWENLLMPGLPFTGLVMMPVWLANRSTHSRLALGGGPGNLLRRDLYQRLGGHEALRTSVVDDIALVRLVRRHRIRTVAARADRLVCLRMYRGLGEIIEGFTKNLSVAMANGIVPALAALVLGIVLHLLPFVLALVALTQWFVGMEVSPAALLGLITVGVITMIRLILFAVLDYRLDSALFGHPLMAAAFLYILARSAWTLTVRRELKWRGRSYSADWVTFGGEPSKLRRP